jgi:ABC-type Zn uptake system ZnuABC Zn-binding protein ZnuA
MRPTLLLAVLASLALAVGACGDSDDSSSGDAAIGVVATTPQAADFARNVGGERAAVTQILQPNSDPHEYDPRPSDARAVAESDLVVRSGGDLDEWLDDIVEGGAPDRPQLTLLDEVARRQGDPHWWQDPRNVERAVLALRDAFSEQDPEGHEDYERNARAYVEKVRRLDREVGNCIGRVPAAKRKLVTSHDAFGYYARRYGLEVLGAVIPALTTQAAPSAGETERLVEEIRHEGVEAVFPESSIDPKLERAIADEAGAQVGKPLLADALAPRGEDGDTYLEALSADTAAMVEGLSGGSVRCRPRA